MSAHVCEAAIVFMWCLCFDGNCVIQTANLSFSSIGNIVVAYFFNEKYILEKRKKYPNNLMNYKTIYI